MHVATLAPIGQDNLGGSHGLELAGCHSKRRSRYKFSLLSNRNHSTRFGPGVACHPFDFDDPYWADLRLPARLEELGVDILHAPAPFALSVRTSRVIATLHNIAPITHPELVSGVTPEEFISEMAQLAGRVAAIVVPSAHAARELKKALPKSVARVVAIPRPVADEYRPMARDDAMSVVLNYRVRLPYILLLGPVSRTMNTRNIVEAFAQALEKGEGSHSLVLIGSPAKDPNEVRELAQELGIEERVVHIENAATQDLPQLIAGADVLIHAVRHDDSGINVARAMACGTPAIVSDLPSLAEIAGDAALSVDPEDLDEIAGAIRKLLEDKMLSKSLSDAGIERAGQFRSSVIGPRLAKLYKSVLNGGKREDRD